MASKTRDRILEIARAAKEAGEQRLPFATEQPSPPTASVSPPSADVEEDLDDLDDDLEDDGDPSQGPVASEGELPDKLYFRIGEVARLVGVDAHVLRYWEGEFKMKPHRSSSGQRLYRKQDLSRFLRIKHLLHDEGYTIQGARRVMTEISGGAAGVDPARIREAIELLESLRFAIQDFRDEIDPS